MNARSIYHASLMTLLMFAAAPLHAAVYSYTDERGIKHFSDVPSDTRYRLLRGEPKSVPPPQAAMPVVTNANASVAPPLSSDPLHGLILAAAAKHRVEAALIRAVIQVESNFNSRAVSPRGARGLMQLMPDTAQRLGVADALDPRQNLEGGVRYLATLIALFNNDLRLVLAAYNAGESAVIQHGNRIPPYRETHDYVFKVLAIYRQFSGGSTTRL